MKKFQDLTPEEADIVFNAIKSGTIDSSELTSDVFIETDPAQAFNTITEEEKIKLSGEEIRVVYAGQARDFLGLRGVIASMVRGELEADKHPYFTKDPISGVWQHDGNKTTLTISVTGYEDED